MDYITFLLFFISLILLVLSLIKPSLVSKIIKNPSRKKNGWFFGSATIALFILFGFFAEPVDNTQTNDNTNNIANQQVREEQNKNTNQDSNEKPEEYNQITDISNNLYLVVSVIDGDTIDIDMDGKIERLRLIGIDTPETKDPRKPVQCFGQEASDKATELLLNQKVKLELDPTQSERDKYDRLLAYVYREDGLFFNKWMVENGYAYEYTYNVPYKYQVEFKEAEDNARSNQLGLWSPDTCNGSPDLTGTTSEENSQPPVDNSNQQPEPEQQPADNNYSCSVAKNCGDMVSCEEAYFYLNTCGKSSLDRDNDGIPCESICN